MFLTVNVRAETHAAAVRATRAVYDFMLADQGKDCDVSVERC